MDTQYIIKDGRCFWRGHSWCGFRKSARKYNRADGILELLRVRSNVSAFVSVNPQIYQYCSPADRVSTIKLVPVTGGAAVMA